MSHLRGLYILTIEYALLPYFSQVRQRILTSRAVQQHLSTGRLRRLADCVEQRPALHRTRGAFAAHGLREDEVQSRCRVAARHIVCSTSAAYRPRVLSATCVHAQSYTGVRPVHFLTHSDACAAGYRARSPSAPRGYSLARLPSFRPSGLTRLRALQ